MEKKQAVVQIVGLVAAIAAMELVFFHAPDLGAKPVRAAGSAAKGGFRLLSAPAPASSDSLAAPGEEKHLRNIKQLTFGGENAEAYWSFDGKLISLQSTRDGGKADQIYVMNADGSSPHMVSTGKGRCTCSYITRDGERVIFASTHLGGDEPPPPPDYSNGYVWAVYPTYDIFSTKLDGSDMRRITRNPGYDAEGTISPDGNTLVFTSYRNGDLDIYTTDLRGRTLHRLTDELGYDGGAFFSPDGKQICYRANHPKTEAEIAKYKDLLSKNLVQPLAMELFIMDADGSNKRQITHNGAANFCPFFTPDGKKLIFASNMADPQGRNFDLYTINVDGTGQERITSDPQFDAFPMFSPDGKKLVWAANRNARVKGETNVFVADWVP